MRAADPMLRAFERDAVVACVGLSAAALIVPAGGPLLSVSVLGGGTLSAVSYRAIRRTVTGLAGGRPGVGTLVNFFTRHAILAFVAYVMLARLGLHPLGVIVGASSPLLAAAAAAARLVLNPGRPRR